ncbi:Transmembrane amino acid transporter protein, putative [Angomonas deanei]|uniref:Transmembrane amino acid transporter protein, putative n=1 Tax=Angomonas deanei TaxID=59799 RepID=A0A7G2CH18_9TRYP|nr:Transmembrane amino acid transporter protein, putative [Angomonas deanei]
MIIKCFGACVAYVICVGDVWSAFLRKEYVGEYYSSRGFISFLTAVAFVCLMLPLSLPKHINSLRYVSLVGVSFILLFVLGVIVHSCAAIAQPDFDNGGLVYFQSGENALRGMGLFMFAYLCQSNMFEVWNEMRPAPTVRRMEVEGFIGMLICTVLYWFSGLFGYLEFGENIRPSLLSMYTPTKNIFFAFAYCGIVVKLCVAFALHVLPCRDAIYHLIEWNLETLLRNKNIAFCASLSLLSLLLGLLIPNISVVFGLLGSFAGGFVGFIFPALFFMYCGGFTVEAVGYQDFYGAYALLISGVIVVCFGTTVTIYNYF